jgi:hypothetical protein
MRQKKKVNNSRIESQKKKLTTVELRELNYKVETLRCRNQTVDHIIFANIQVYN